MYRSFLRVSQQNEGPPFVPKRRKERIILGDDDDRFLALLFLPTFLHRQMKGTVWNTVLPQP